MEMFWSLKVDVSPRVSLKSMGFKEGLANVLDLVWHQENDSKPCCGVGSYQAHAVTALFVPSSCAIPTANVGGSRQSPFSI